MFGWAGLSHEKVAQFYRDWGDFVTKKEFLEADQYDVRQAPDRWVKRKMESENKKARTKVRKLYIDGIRCDSDTAVVGTLLALISTFIWAAFGLIFGSG